MDLAPRWHRGIDALAMWVEDQVSRPPQPYRPGPDGPLGCFGPLASVPSPPPGPGRWRFPAGAPGAAEGDRVVVHRRAARGPRRGTAILVPPWKTPWPIVLSAWTRMLAGQGLEVWLLVPPHHRERTLPGQRSGEGFVGNDLGGLRAALEQTVREIRTLAAAAAPAGPVGLVGLSLGGLAAAHAATAPEPLAFAALVAPPTDLGDLFARTPIGARYRRLAERAGAPFPAEGALRERLRPFWPGGRRPSAGRLLVLAGEHDAVVAAGGPRALALAWGTPLRIHPRGHLTLLLACAAARREVAELARGALAGLPD